MNYNPEAKLILINMNNFSAEKDESLTEIIFNKLGEHFKYLEQLGIDIKEIHWKIKDSEKHKIFEFIFEHLFPNHKAVSYEHKYSKVNGTPDYLLEPKEKYKEAYKDEKDKGKIWVEIKRENDGLKKNQFQWIIDNKHKKTIYILMLDF